MVELRLQDLSWLLFHLVNVASKWQNLGVHLNIHPDRLKIIDEDTKGCENCLRKTLTFWLNQNPNAEQLLNALNRVDEQVLSATLKERIIQGDHQKG